MEKYLMIILSLITITTFFSTWYYWRKYKLMEYQLEDLSKNFLAKDIKST